MYYVCVCALIVHGEQDVCQQQQMCLLLLLKSLPG